MEKSKRYRPVVPAKFDTNRLKIAVKFSSDFSTKIRKNKPTTLYLLIFFGLKGVAEPPFGEGVDEEDTEPEKRVNGKISKPHNWHNRNKF